MNRLLRCALCVVIAATGHAYAGEVFKCRARDGGLSYQDRACAADAEALDAPMLPRTYLPPPVEAVAMGSTQTRKSTPPSVMKVRVEDPLPQMFRCTSPDETSYVSSDPTSRGRYVPLWTLGVGRTGAGLSNGTLAPHYGAQYTYAEDRCRAMPRGELCGWWKQRADETGSERRRAFNDRRAALDQEYAGARDALARFCG